MLTTNSSCSIKTTFFSGKTMCFLLLYLPGRWSTHNTLCRVEFFFSKFTFNIRERRKRDFCAVFFLLLVCLQFGIELFGHCNIAYTSLESAATRRSRRDVLSLSLCLLYFNLNFWTFRNFNKSLHTATSELLITRSKYKQNCNVASATEATLAHTSYFRLLFCYHLLRRVYFFFSR
jgi:hypothetical protein